MTTKTYLLEQTGEKAIETLLSNESALIRAIPGMGLYTLTQEICAYLKAKHSFYTLNLYPYEGANTTTKDIERMFIDKFKMENNVHESNMVYAHSAIGYLHKTNTNLVIVLNKVYRFKTASLYLEYFDSVQRASNKKITLLVTTCVEDAQKVVNGQMKLSALDIIFPGFINKHRELVERIFSQQDLNKNTAQALADDVSRLVGGHAGLLKSLAIYLKKTNSSTLSIPELLKNSDIQRRLNEISNSLAEAGLDYLKTEDTVALNELGLKQANKSFKLFEAYFLENLTQRATLPTGLTETEIKIFKILKKHPETYLNQEAILKELGEVYYYNSSDWSLYKHLNNLSKKLKKWNYKLTNKRGQGYSLHQME